jgi:hypothetical protein
VGDLGRIILTWSLRSMGGVRVWTGFIWLRIGTNVGLLWIRNGSSGFIKGRKFLEELSDSSSQMELCLTNLSWLVTWWCNGSWGDYNSIVTKLTSWRLGFDFRQGQGRIFSLRHRVQAGSEVHPSSCLLGKGGGRSRREADHSYSSIAELNKNARICTSIPSCLHGFVLN